MVIIRRAEIVDVNGIIKVCSDGYRNAYIGLLPQHHIEKIIKEFYNEERVLKEVQNINKEWNGWFVAIDNGQVVGAGGGGLINDEVSELFVLYLDPARKREGIGSRLLASITQDQISRGAKEQWVSVMKDNEMGIPFYEAVGFEYLAERNTHSLPEDEGFRSLRYKRSLV